MRLDKYLKTARILKRREAAKELALQQRIKVNGRIAKPSTEIEIGNVIEIEFGLRILEIRVLDIQKQVSKQNAQLLFEIIKEEKINESCMCDIDSK
ncbi:RNA-binding S4 domain-containing protein [Floccifex sp.]|uniref:RNA-binding S4 domain-containing protein n=1 Tax=Floccifex sp. TaxID=2815810 RepID=UPI003F0B0B88